MPYAFLDYDQAGRQVNQKSGSDFLKVSIVCKNFFEI